MDYTYTQASTDKHLSQIRRLQKANLKSSLSSEEIAQEGFVTCEHELTLLEKMNHPDGHIIATSKDQVVGYALVMSPLWRDELEVLKPMFVMMDNLTYRQVSLSSRPYIVMGQVCIDKDHRRQGIFRGMYQYYRSCLQPKFDYCITEIATENLRSRSAHEAIGFRTLHSYRAEDGINWELVIWDWTTQ